MRLRRLSDKPARRGDAVNKSVSSVPRLTTPPRCRERAKEAANATQRGDPSHDADYRPFFDVFRPASTSEIAADTLPTFQHLHLMIQQIFSSRRCPRPMSTRCLCRRASAAAAFFFFYFLCAADVAARKIKKKKKKKKKKRERENRRALYARDRHAIRAPLSPDAATPDACLFIDSHRLFQLFA